MAHDPEGGEFGNMLTFSENSISILSKHWCASNPRGVILNSSINQNVGFSVLEKDHFPITLQTDAHVSKLFWVSLLGGLRWKFLNSRLLDGV